MTVLHAHYTIAESLQTGLIKHRKAWNTYSAKKNQKGCITCITITSPKCKCDAK